MSPKDVVNRLKNPDPVSWWMGRIAPDVPLEELPGVADDFSALFREYPDLVLQGVTYEGLADDFFVKLTEVAESVALRLSRENLRIGFGIFASSISKYLGNKRTEEGLPDAADRARTSDAPTASFGDTIPKIINSLVDDLDNGKDALPPRESALRLTERLNFLASGDEGVDPRVSMVAKALLEIIYRSDNPIDGVSHLRVLRSFSIPGSVNVTKRMILLVYNGERELFGELFRFFSELKDKSELRDTSSPGRGDVGVMSRLVKFVELLGALLMKSKTSSLGDAERSMVKEGVASMREMLGRTVVNNEGQFTRMLQDMDAIAGRMLEGLGASVSAPVSDVARQPATVVRGTRRRPRRSVRQGRSHAVQTARRTPFRAARAPRRCSGRVS